MRSPAKRWALLAVAVPAVVAALVLGTTSASASSSAWPTCLGEPATIVGTDGNDTITGTTDDDVIVGLAGDDQILGNGGFDLICGGDGNDSILQNDRGFFGGLAFIAGDAGDDTVQAAGDALVVADYEDSPAPVTVDLGAGTATGNGTDTLIGAHGAWGSRFDDVLTGSPGRDFLLGDDGNDTLSALAGSDLVEGDLGNDVLDGGTGRDQAWYGDSATAVRVNLAKGTAAGEGTDRLTSVEDVKGSKRADVLIGNSRPNTFDGYGGNDLLYGAAGKDRLDGGAGKDRADGGAGRDVCHAERKVRCP